MAAQHNHTLSYGSNDTPSTEEKEQFFPHSSSNAYNRASNGSAHRAIWGSQGKSRTFGRSTFDILCAFFALITFIALISIPAYAFYKPLSAPSNILFMHKLPSVLNFISQGFTWSSVTGFIGTLANVVFALALSIVCKWWLRNRLRRERGINSIELDLAFNAGRPGALWHSNMEKTVDVNHPYKSASFLSSIASTFKNTFTFAGLFSLLCFANTLFIQSSINTLYQERSLNRTVTSTFEWPRLSQNPTTLESFSSCDPTGQNICGNLSDTNIINNAILPLTFVEKVQNTLQVGASIYTVSDDDLNSPNGTIRVSQDLALLSLPAVLANLNVTDAQAIDACAPTMDVHLSCVSGFQSDIVGYDFSSCQDQLVRPNWSPENSSFVEATMQACTLDSDVVALIFGYSVHGNGQFTMQCNASLIEGYRTISSAVNYDQTIQAMRPSNVLIGDECGNGTAPTPLPLGPTQNLLRGVAAHFQNEFYYLQTYNQLTPQTVFFNDLQNITAEAEAGHTTATLDPIQVRAVLVKALAAQAMSSYSTATIFQNIFPPYPFTFYTPYQAIQPHKSDLIWFIPLVFCLLMSLLAVISALVKQLNGFSSPSELIAFALQSPQTMDWNGKGLELLLAATRKTRWAVRDVPEENGSHLCMVHSNDEREELGIPNIYSQYSA